MSFNVARLSSLSIWSHGDFDVVPPIIRASRTLHAYYRFRNSISHLLMTLNYWGINALFVYTLRTCDSHEERKSAQVCLLVENLL
jgi:hypothetical protein